jgi:hypothetical protein
VSLTESTNRRQFVLGALGATSSLGAPRCAGPTSASSRWHWPQDLDGDGVISEADRPLLSGPSSLHEWVRGERPQPRDAWDPRLDFLSRGRLGTDQLQRYDAARPAIGTRLPPRPIVACWHYGWYGPGRRRGEPATVRYLGGSYMSRDRRTEEEFNALKEEFGISADLLSWTDERRLLQAYERAYLSAANHARRRFGLLYESNISLGTTKRIDFAPEGPAAEKPVRDFRRMGSWLAAVDTNRLLKLDDRPVVFVFGSHTFGPTRANLPHVGRALGRARAAFAETFGPPPLAGRRRGAVSGRR